MKKIKNKENTNFTENVYSIGVDLSIVESLVKFLDISLYDELNFSKMDFANLTTVIQKYIQNIKKKYNKIEYQLEKKSLL